MNLEADVYLDAAPEVVWQRLLDPETWPLLVPGLKQVELVDAPPLAVGSRARFTMEQAGQRLVTEAELTELAPLRRLGLQNHVEALAVDMAATWTLAAEGAGTRLTQDVDLAFRNPFLRAMGEGIVRAQNPEARVREGLARLKDVVEGPG